MMQEKSEPSLPSDKTEEAGGLFSSANSFFTEKKYPGGAKGAPPTAPTPEQEIAKPQRKRILVMVVIPAVLFIAAVAGIAAMTQFLPNWRGSLVKKDDGRIKPIIHFTESRFALWKVGDRIPGRKDAITALPYNLEMEQMDEGYYDYCFYNSLSDKDVEVGLIRTGCDCSEVQICVLPKKIALEHPKRQRQREKWTDIPKDGPLYRWEKLPKSETKGQVIPAGKGGLIRLRWTARKSAGQFLKLDVHLWMQPKGEPSRRQYRVKEPLEALVKVVEPVMFAPMRLDVHELGPKQSETRKFICWSATQDEFEVVFPKYKQNPCIKCKAVRISDSERKEMERGLRLRYKIITHLRTGYVVYVTVTEETGNERLPIGSLREHVPLEVLLHKQPLSSVVAPMIRGRIPSAVKVGPSRTSHIDLDGRFSVNEDSTVKGIYLYAPKGTKLKLRKDKSRPSFLRVDMKEVKAKGDFAKWEVAVTVPQGTQRNSFPEESRLLFQAKRPDGTSRLVAIPITGAPRN